MGQKLRKLFCRVVTMTIVFAFFACGGDDEDKTLEILPDESQEESYEVNLELLYGTWMFDWGNNSNIDYFCFDENGNGTYLEAGALYTNAEEFNRDYKFTWNLDGDNVNINFSDGTNGVIKITSLTEQELIFKRINFEYAWKTVQPTFVKVGDSADWFYNNGPASEDLTSSVCGTYTGTVRYNSGEVFIRNEEVVITRLSNDSVNIKNSWVSSSSSLNGTGYLNWCDKDKTPIEIHRISGAYPYEITGDNIKMGYISNSGTLIFEGVKKKTKS